MARGIIKRSSGRGFSLTEVLIAMVIFTIGIIAIMYLFPLGMQEISRTKDLTAAIFLGQAKLEEVLLLPAHVAPVEESSFTEYPSLFFRVTKTAFQNKPSLIQISVEVSKMRDGGSVTIMRYDALKGAGGNIENNF
ncbi:MAG: prepilin-type N-terminal cleavage/methylation domain-containing protein [Candidatus Eremiobacteraeota bacterium]|nr:prepilin-type N-terminal cleavage/methylation domain-containing protein [Candidatus Eremiobacteraeota bacterium]